MMTKVIVSATRWDGGWELAWGDEHITQVRSLSKAQSQVRDYLDTFEPEVDHSIWEVSLRLASEEDAEMIRSSRNATAAAQEAQRRAAENTRAVVDVLIGRGLPVADVAILLGISSGRVSQLRKAGPARPAQ